MRYFSILRAAVCVLVSTGSMAFAAPERRFTVRDSIELSTFVRVGSQYMPSSRVSFSPDGAHFVAVTMRGDLKSGKREATMWLFDCDGVRDYLSHPAAAYFDKAKPLVRFASASNHEPLNDWRWTEDSKSILFLGADDDGAERLYRVGLAGGDPVALSRADQDVNRYEERNGAIVYFAHAPIRAEDLYQAGGASLPDMEVATGKNILPLIFPNWMDAQFRDGEDELWKIEGDKAVSVLGPDRKTPVKLRDSRLILAPNGRQVVLTPSAKHIPKSWEKYQPLIDYPGFRIVADTPETEGGTDRYRPKQYALLGLDDGKMSLLADAPIEMTGLFYSHVTARWTADSSHIALSALYPKPSASMEAAKAASMPSCTLAVVDTHGGDFSCVQVAAPVDTNKNPYPDRLQMVDLQWRNHDQELVATYVTPNAPDKKVIKAFFRQGSTWAMKEEPAPTEVLAVSVRESLDESPVLVAGLNGGASRPLFDPNPQLKNIALGKAAFYEWRDANGNAWTGALVTPPGFSKNRRYPLVIQTHGLDRAKFLVDGPSATGFAARAFSAKDIVVLQVQEINKESGTPKESEIGGAAGYRAAIKQLAEERIVDPAKVGIITWSHYGPHAMQGLIDEPHAYAAATWAEAAYNSYGEYLINIDYMGSAREKMFRAQFGAKPFGEGLKQAVENSPGFHTDRVCTPILFQMNGPPSLIYGWDAYAAIRAQNKPIDLFYIRNGDHVLVKPLQRLAEQGMNVDWYDYWLNGRKDPDAGKSAQYKRWDALKALPRCGSDVADSTKKP
ncbi:alpha/beta hydrolase family protein [Rudaea cellulosilytica]|uniref:alpha/beta hydrolase family protein n=1 Tax=Rudaea cellulosilytica TaxID=540746 RepID=UPI00039C1CC5|nr:hypothetical protein [Rudaea cellulosilytica]